MHGLPGSCPLPGRIRHFQDLSQIGSALERLDIATFGDGTGHAPGKTLFAVFLEHPGDFFHGRGVDEFRRADPTGRVHAHVQRTIVEEAETALRVILLWRRDAQIEQSPLTLPFIPRAATSAPSSAKLRCTTTKRPSSAASVCPVAIA